MARSGSFRAGLRPFGGGTLDANAAFIMPPPPEPVAPPMREAPPPRGTGQVPKPIIPGRSKPAVKPAAAARRPVAKRAPAKPAARAIVKPKPVVRRPTAVRRRPPPPPPSRTTGGTRIV